MIIVEDGHVYDLRTLDGEPDEHERLRFICREQTPSLQPHPGTQTQEVLRALIDRTMHCDNCLRWPGNDAIIFHLRAALVAHEQRALMRKLEKGLYRPEDVRADADGHFRILPHETLSPDGYAYRVARGKEEAR